MFEKVLVPVDVTVPDDAQKLLTAARSLIDPWQAELHVATVVPTVTMPIVGSYFDKDFESQSNSAAAQELAAAMTAAGLDGQAHVLAGTVYDAVLKLASQLDPDLIVIGAHQPDLRDYLLGSNAARVVRHSKRSVLVIR